MKGEVIMNNFFDNLSKCIADTVDDLGKKAEDTLEIQKIKNQVRGWKRENDRDFIDMGKIIYERFQDDEELDENLVRFCEEIKKRNQQIEECVEQIERIKDI